MDISYSYLEISAFMILRLVYLIIIAMDKINTKYEMLAFLTVRDGLSHIQRCKCALNTSGAQRLENAVAMHMQNTQL